MRTIRIMDNLERQLSRAGLSVTRTDRESISIVNGANLLKVSYELFGFSSPKGGVDGKQHPFLGMHGVQPGSLVLTSSMHVAGSVADVIDSDVAAKVLVILASFGNDIILRNDDASFELKLFPNVDHPGMGV